MRYLKTQFMEPKLTFKEDTTLSLNREYCAYCSTNIFYHKTWKGIIFFPNFCVFSENYFGNYLKMQNQIKINFKHFKILCKIFSIRIYYRINKSIKNSNTRMLIIC